ncbi:MAG: HAMP domain-containing protein [Lachnospiraceae bacterium]|nr:HAMP domain-containing protein [Lachnospiraceae bacterium]
MKKAINQSTLTFILNAISILTLLFIAVSLISYSRVSRQLNTANEERFQLTYNANRFMNGSSYLTNEVRAFAATGEQEHYDNYWNEVNTLKNRDQGVAAMQEIGITTEEQTMIDKMSSLSNNLVPLEENAMEQVQNGNLEDALNYVYGSDYNAAITQINSLKEEFLNTLEQRTAEETARLGRLQNSTRDFMFLAVILVALIQLSVVLLINRKILRPVLAVEKQMGEISQGNLSAAFSLQPDTSEIGRLVASIHETKQELKKYINDIDDKLAQIAQGNMDLSIEEDYRGEFLPIQNAMRQILDSLNQALLQINYTAEQVAQESERMTSDAQILSSGAVAQASAVQELSASIQELSREVDRTSSDANEARECSTSAANQLMYSNGKMDELTKAMEDISAASQQIGGIIKTIEDISFQTNILALNAAVEAARAGEAGKGFAVVAEEVQSLANKSATSAKGITELIENSIRMIKQGSNLASETTTALAGVMVGAKQATDLIEEIAGSATQQSQALHQLTQGMEQIAEVVQTNATTAEKSVDSARSLMSQAEEMKVAVQRFRLRR